MLTVTKLDKTYTSEERTYQAVRFIGTQLGGKNHSLGLKRLSFFKRADCRGRWR